MASGRQGAVLREVRRLFESGTVAGLDEAGLLGRFVAHRDEAAFAALVARFGPMVLGVCRRRLRDPRDVEDTFQATFLVLVEKAGSIREPDLLGPWLYGVACRVVGRAGKVAARRPLRERPGAEAEAIAVGNRGHADLDELRAALDQEIRRLPEALRLAVVLCHLEGLSQPEAARRLRWTPGALRGRLARAREKLRARLARRGFALPGGLLMAALGTDAASAAVPAPLIEATIRLADAGAVPTASAAALAKGAIRAMTMTRLGSAAGTLLAIGAVGAVVAGVGRGAIDDGPRTVAARGDGRPENEQAKARAGGVERPEADRGETRTIEFRVVRAKSGGPIPGATVVLDRRERTRFTTDDEGRCAVALPGDIPDIEGFSLSTWKDGFTPIRVSFTGRDLHGEGRLKSYTVELEPAGTMGGIVRDGRGMPIAGAKVTVSFFRVLILKDHEEVMLDGSDPVETDEDGRWSLRMLPDALTDDDALWIRLSHSDYVSDAWESSRPKPSVKALRERTNVLVMEEGLPVNGEVVDAEGKPLAGAPVVLAWGREGHEQYKTETDVRGHFRFGHVAAGPKSLTVRASGFGPEWRSIDVKADTAPMAFRLGPGRTIDGRVVDEKGRPAAGAEVFAGPWHGVRTLDWRARTDADGRFRWAHAPAEAVALNVRKDLLLKPALIEVAPDRAEVVATLKGSLKLTGKAVDAETGRLIGRVRVVPGVTGYPRSIRGGKLPDGRERPHWQYNDARRFDDGRFAIEFPYPDFVPRFARVEAEGYLPEVSREYKSDEGEQVWEVKLRRGSGVSGVVRSPDGAPMAGAQVVLVGLSDDARFQGGRIDPTRIKADHAEADADGRFWFARPDEPFAVVVLSDRGIAVRTAWDFADSNEVTVRPWGRIEGTLKVGRGPGAKRPVSAHIDAAARDPDGPALSFRYEAETDADGRFAFDRVVPGEVVVHRDFPRKFGSIWTHLAHVEVRPGEAAQVTIGGDGRPVVGRVAMPADTVSLLDLSRGSGMLTVDRPAPYPEELLSWPPEKKQAWWATFQKTPEGRDYLRGDNRFGVAMAADGSFRAEDVPAGRYKLNLSVEQSQPGALGRAGSNLVAQAARDVVVPEMPGGRADEPLDLGALELAITNYRRLEVGDVAPDFAIRTVEGKPLSLADFKGKYVLLDFWATWCAPCVAETPNLKAIHDAFGRDDRFALIGLSLDDEPGPPRKYSAEHGLAWPQGHLGGWSEATVTADYGVQSIPQVLLIGPDGRVVAKDLRGDRIKRVVAEALGREPTDGG